MRLGAHEISLLIEVISLKADSFGRIAITFVTTLLL